MALLAVRVMAVAQIGCTTGGGCNPPPGPPPPDECDNPSSTAIVTGVEIGPGLVDPFEPWQGGEPVEFVTGGQGSDMLVLKIRVTGTDLPDCMMQRTIVGPVGDTGGYPTTYTSPVRWYGTAEQRNTAAVYVIIEGYLQYDMPIQVETTVREVVVTRQLWLGSNPPPDAELPDATVDAALPDGAPVDAEPPDGAPVDAEPVDASPSDAGP